MDQAQVNQPITFIFECIDTASPPNQVPGQAGAIIVQLRDEDGPASEMVTISEQGGNGASGFYEATLTPTRSSPQGREYYLSVQTPPSTTDGAKLPFTFRCFPVIAVTPISGSFLTTLDHVKEYLGSVAADDSLLTNLIARVSRLIEAFCDRAFPRATYTEILDGSGRPLLMLRRAPIVSLASVHMSQDQVWDGTTLLAASSIVMDPSGFLLLKAGAFAAGIQNIRAIYDAGYDTIPFDIEQIAIEMIARTFKDKGQIHLSSMSLKDGAYTKRFASRFYEDLVQDLSPYIRRRAA